MGFQNRSIYTDIDFYDANANRLLTPDTNLRGLEVKGSNNFGEFMPESKLPESNVVLEILARFHVKSGVIIFNFIRIENEFRIT